MGKHFGNLAYIRGIVYFRLSAHEQKAFAGFINPGFHNFVRRFREHFPVMAPCFMLSYLTYDWGTKKHKELSRKNPKDFENDT